MNSLQQRQTASIPAFAIDCPPPGLPTIYLQDSSMDPVMPAGSMLAFNPSDKSIENGKLYLIDVEGRQVVRQLKELPGGLIKASCFNAAEFPAKVFGLGRKAMPKVIGRVVWWSVLDQLGEEG